MNYSAKHGCGETTSKRTLPGTGAKESFCAAPRLQRANLEKGDGRSKDTSSGNSPVVRTVTTLNCAGGVHFPPGKSTQAGLARPREVPRVSPGSRPRAQPGSSHTHHAPRGSIQLAALSRVFRRRACPLGACAESSPRYFSPWRWRRRAEVLGSASSVCVFD